MIRHFTPERAYTKKIAPKFDLIASVVFCLNLLLQFFYNIDFCKSNSLNCSIFFIVFFCIQNVTQSMSGVHIMQ